MKFSLLFGLLMLYATHQSAGQTNNIPARNESEVQFPFANPTLDLEIRIDDLISRLTLDEKIAFLKHDNPEVERLGIRPYSWWGEAAHGVSRSGIATVFPQSIGLAATFDKDLMRQVATVISTEGRAKYNIAQSIGNYGAYAGLSFWAPNINIMRDPRWGRGQETYGEDPFLTGQMAVAFANGMQGDHPKYLKTAICAKHFAVHSGPEDGRKKFNAQPPLKDFHETYLPAFKAMIMEGKAEIVMCAYSQLYGKPCCGHKMLLTEILRNDWGFKGHVVSDCSAVEGILSEAKYTKTNEETVALALNSGLDMNCGSMYKHLKGAIEQGLVEETQINEKLRNVLRSRFKLGLFDPPGTVPYDTLGAADINTSEARQLAREAAGKSIILAKNANKVLPLKKDLRKIYIVGPSAANLDVLLGSYYGTNNDMKTILEGINGKISYGTSMEYKYGFSPDEEDVNPLHWWHMTQMNATDAIILCAGLSGQMEGEDGETILTPNNGDRKDIKLPQCQIDFIKRVSEYGDTPIILIITGGSPIALGEAEMLADAILYVGYPGEEGGTAIADVIFGDVNPAGRFPYTVPKSTDQLPAFNDYSMEERTYKYMTKEPLFPFGFGLSYTTFSYSDIKTDKKKYSKNDSIVIEVSVKNTGNVAGDEVVQLYLTRPKTNYRTPLFDLKGFERIHLKPEEAKLQQFKLAITDFETVNPDGEYDLLQGTYTITVGGALPISRSISLGGSDHLKTTVVVD